MSLGTKIGIIASIITNAFSNLFSLSFDGVNDQLDFGIWNLLDSQSTFSLSFWIKSGVDASNAYVIARVEGIAQFLVFQNGINSSLKYRIYTTTTLYTLIGGTVLDNQWHHCMMTYDGSNFEIFEDGASVTSIAANGPLVVSTSKLRVATFGGSAPFKTGNIDEISIFDTDQSANISTLSASPTVDLTSLSPLGWWRMGDNDTFPIITDNGSGGFDGTMTNMDAGDIVSDTP